MTIQRNSFELQRKQQQVKEWGAVEELKTKAAAVTPLIDESIADPAIFARNGLKEVVHRQQNGAHAVEIPAEFVLPPHLQPGLSAKGDHIALNLPLIDMSGVYDNPERRKQIAASIDDACRNWGFFQVVGHGVPEELRQRILSLGREFFNLPVSEKAKWTGEQKNLPIAKPSLGKSRTTSSGHQSWRDLFRHRIDPVRDAEVNEWPTTPKFYRETMMEYTRATTKLTTTLFELMSEGLNLSSQHIHQSVGGAENLDHVIMLANYPRCPQPDLALGIIGHTDPNLLTLVIQDDVGLEVKKDGFWIPVVQAYNGFVVNIGDSLQIMTNDMYTSAEHRVVTNAKRDRISAMVFVQPQNHVNVGVMSDVVPTNKTAIYKAISWSEHLKYAKKGLDNKLTELARK
ncbi:unnamed protein product [Calypogeia fissa]